MNFHDVDKSVIDKHLSPFAPVEFAGKGGQKRVFKCEHEGETWALPLLLVSDDPDVSIDDDDSGFGLKSDQVVARVRREVKVMRECASPHLVGMGPIDITPIEIENLSILYFLEEFIEGEDVKAIIAKGPMALDEIVRLATHVTKAIDSLWNASTDHRVIHRDLKPANIMRRTSNGDFIVLDIGLAFDMLDESISNPGQVPGTALYLTPDQIDNSKKRQMDFRTDMFALGVILYEAVTGQHPYYTVGMSSFDLFNSILHSKPRPISDFRKDVPPKLIEIIWRLLSKKQHLRYRTCDALLEALAAAEKELGT